MQAAVRIAIIATIISFISLIVAVITCLISVQNYKKSKRLEFFQRRDQLFAKISDLNAKNSEAHLISARFGIVLLNRASQPLMDEKHAEENKTQMASIKKLVENIDLVTNHSEVLIKQLHSICSSLAPKTDPTRVENLIAMVQTASDEAKQCNEVYLSSLHTLETTDPMLRASVAKLHELEIRRAELDLEKAIMEIKRNDKAPD